MIPWRVWSWPGEVYPQHGIYIGFGHTKPYRGREHVINLSFDPINNTVSGIFYKDFCKETHPFEVVGLAPKTKAPARENRG